MDDIPSGHTPLDETGPDFGRHLRLYYVVDQRGAIHVQYHSGPEHHPRPAFQLRTVLSGSFDRGRIRHHHFHFHLCHYRLGPCCRPRRVLGQATERLKTAGESSMKQQDVFDVIYTHTEVKPLCIINSGIPYPLNTTILEKRKFLADNYDWVRKALMREPRGHNDMFGVFLTPPSSPEFDAGLIYIDGETYSHMCGHGTIAVAMAMVALGIVQ